MYNLNTYAFRKDGVIYVTITGNLPNSCYTAQIIDKYPGGNIVYVNDPGTAQVFIEESLKPGSAECLMVLVPWVSHVKIVDNDHGQITVFVNSEPMKKTEIGEEPKDFRVIALTASLDEGYSGCSVIPADAYFLTIYSSVYGPASKAECVKWLGENCIKSLSDIWPWPWAISIYGETPGRFPW